MFTVYVSFQETETVAYGSLNCKDPMDCPVCDITISNSYSLGRHLKRKHKTYVQRVISLTGKTCNDAVKLLRKLVKKGEIPLLNLHLSSPGKVSIFFFFFFFVAIIIIL